MKAATRIRIFDYSSSHTGQVEGGGWLWCQDLLEVSHQKMKVIQPAHQAGQTNQTVIVPEWSWAGLLSKHPAHWTS